MSLLRPTIIIKFASRSGPLYRKCALITVLSELLNIIWSGNVTSAVPLVDIAAASCSSSCEIILRRTHTQTIITFFKVVETFQHERTEISHPSYASKELDKQLYCFILPKWSPCKSSITCESPILQYSIRNSMKLSTRKLERDYRAGI